MDYEPGTKWPSDRRCGYIFHSYNSYVSGTGGWVKCYAGTNGSWADTDHLSSEQRCNCTQKYGPFQGVDSTYPTYYSYDNYGAICSYYTTYEPSQDYNAWLAVKANYQAFASWASSRTCPKGWGKSYCVDESDTSNYVKYAQGHTSYSTSVPIYGYVTRYRTVYYNYLGCRVAKS